MCRYDNKISKAAAQAFIERRPFRRDDTEVVVTSPSCAVLKLYGHVIGENSESRGMHLTMAGWGTMTTAARLDAVMLGPWGWASAGSARTGNGTTATGCWRARTKSWK